MSLWKQRQKKVSSTWRSGTALTSWPTATWIPSPGAKPSKWSCRAGGCGQLGMEKVWPTLVSQHMFKVWCNQTFSLLQCSEHLSSLLTWFFLLGYFCVLLCFNVPCFGHQFCMRRASVLKLVAGANACARESSVWMWIACTQNVI